MNKQSNQLDDLMQTLLSLKTRDEMINFLEGILTPKELLEIPMRLQIIRMLKEGIPQHKIAEELKIGIATVTRGSKELQKGKFKYV